MGNSKKNKITGEQLLQSYEYDKQHEKNTEAQKITGKQLLDDYYGQSGTRRMESPYKPTKTPEESAREDVLKHLQYYENRQKMKSDMNTLGKNNEVLKTFAAQQGSKSEEAISSAPTSKKILQGMSNEELDYLYNTMKKRNDQAANEGFMAYGKMVKENKNIIQSIESMEDVKTEREQAQDMARRTAEATAYAQKRSEALDNLPEEALELLNQYTQSNASLEETKMIGALSKGYVNVKNLSKYSKEAEETKQKLMQEYGITEKDFNRLAQYAQEIADAEATEEMQNKVKENISEHPWGYGALYSGLDLALSPVTGILASTESLKANKYADEEAPVNTNSSRYRAMNFTNATEQAVNDEIDSPVGRFVYNVGISTAKSAIAASIGGAVTGAFGLTGTAASVVGNMVTLPQFGTSAYASTLQEDQAKGISRENATKHAMAAGAAEMLFEIVSLDKVWEIAGKSGKATAKEVVKDVLVQAGIEGSEEAATSIADRIADDIVNGSMSDYNMNVAAYMAKGYSLSEAEGKATKDFFGEVMMDALAGAASGGLMAGGANAVAAVNYHNLGKYVESNTELKQTVYEAAQKMDESSAVHQIVQDKSVEELTAADTGNILRVMAEEANTDETQVLQERFEEMGESKKQAKKEAKKVIEAVSTPSEMASESESDTREAEFAANENLATVYAETLKGEHSVGLDTVRTAKESYESQKRYSRMVKQGKISKTGVAEVSVKKTGKDAIVVGVQDVSGKNTTVRMSDNSVRNLNDIEFKDQTKQKLYTFATTMENADAGNAVIENYAGESLASYVEACAVFYNAGKLGTSSFESMISNPKNSGLVSNMSSTATLKQMYMLGENNRSAKMSEVAPVQQEASRRKEKRKDEKQGKKNQSEENQSEENRSEAKSETKRKEGKVIDNRANQTDSRIRDIAEQVAKKTGLEITLNDSLANGENGNFQKSLSRIVLSSTAKNEYTTLVHEVNEFAESYNPEGMKKVLDTVLDYAQTQEGAAYLFDKNDGIIQQYQNRYRETVEADKTYEDAAGEFVFDYLSGVFSTQEGVEDFTRYMTEEGMTEQEQKGMLETIADFFKELANKIMSYLDEHVLSSAAKKGLQADAKKAQEIRQMVMDVWQQAEGKYWQETLNSTTGEANFSIDVDLDSELQKYHIENKLNDYIAVQKAVVNRLKETGFFEKNSVVVNEETGMEIRINPRGIKETLANGKRFQTLPRELKKLKIATIEQLPEIIKKGTLIEDSVENTHGESALYAYFTTPVAINGENLTVKVNIRKSVETNKFWIHNVILEKDAELLNPTKKQGIHEIQNPSKSSITQNTEKSIKKYSIDVDSEGRKLSEGQKEYFRDSKVRDESGNLLVMYHGTPQGGFTVFKSDLHFFSQNKNYADIYQSASASSRNSRKEESNPHTYEVYLNIKNPFDIRIPEIREVFINDYVKGGYALGINPYVEYKDTTSTGLPSWEETDNIYEFLEENDLLEEYDGIIVDEGAIPGENREILYRGISYVTFSENQIKRVDNLNPTENKDIRYSIDIDDSLFEALQENYSAQEQEMASIVEEGFESLKHVTVDEKMMHRIAYNIKKEYKSKCDIDALTGNLTRVFAYLKDHQKSVNYDDMVRIVQEIAKPVIEESTDVDSFEKQAYNDFRNYIKAKKIRLSEEQKAEVAYYEGSYENFQKKNIGNIVLSDEGTYLDNLWSEICDNSYGMLERDVSSADQPIELIDMMKMLKPVKKNIYGMDTEQAAYDLALDIFRRYFVEQAEEKANQKVAEKNQRLIVRQQEYRKRVKKEYDESLVRLREVEKQRRQKQAERYEQKLTDLKASMEAMKQYKDMQALNRAKKQAERYEMLLAKTRQNANEKILEIKAANRRTVLEKRQNEEIKQYRERIKKNAKGIISAFNTNTDKNHIPEGLKEPVARFITSVDFISNRASENSVPTMEWRQSLEQMYRKLSDREAAVDGGYIELYETLNEVDIGDRKLTGLLSDMNRFMDANEDVKLFDMNKEQLEQLDELITGLKRAITSVNQLYVNKRTKSVRELGSKTIQELEQKKDKKKLTQAGRMVDNLLDVDMLDSRSYFYRLGDSATSIYDGLRNGFSERVWLLKEAQQYMDGVLEGINVKDWTGEKAQVHEFMVNGQELYMTTAQIMSLYVLNRRNQANTHMKNGGIRPSAIGKGKKAIERITPVKLTDYEIDIICQKLTPEQRKVADAMQKFLGENCADWGNKASMLMYGYKRFGAANYFPIKTDKNSVDTRDDSKFFAVKKQGFTKETKANASNALIVDDIFDVFTKHVTDMATYSTFTAPLMDAMKWFNYRNMDYSEDIAIYGKSVKQEIERTYGRQYLEYFKKLIQDINAETTKGIEAQISDTLTSRMKAASVGANIRVAIQQPTAYLRAAAVMDAKYLGKAVFKKSAVKKAQENSAITQWKSWGYFETSIGRSMKNVITGQDTLKNRIVEKSMTLAQLGDDFTWGYLWNACEAEIMDKNPGVKYDSEEFLKLVAERFDEVVDQTQVVDSVLHRSHMMRSNNGIVQMATSFMAEPTKSYNMLMNRIRDVIEGGGKVAKERLARAVLAYMATNVLNAFVVSFVDAARDNDDDDDTYLKKYWEAWRENIKDGVNPLGLLPYVKDILSILGGYDVSRMDMQGISNVISGAKSLYKYCKDEEYRKNHTLFNTSKQMIRGTSQVLGIPVYNALRDIEAAYNTLTGKHMGGIKRSNTRNYELMADGILEGKTKKYEKAKEDLKENEVGDYDIAKGFKSYLKKAFQDGELSEDDVKNILTEEYGTDAQTAKSYILDWKHDMVESDFKDGVIQTDEAVQRLMSEAEMAREDAKSEITGWKVDQIKDDYLNDWITETEARSKLKKDGEMEEDEVYEKLKEWNYKKENPLATGYSVNTVLFEAIDNAYETGKLDDRDAIRNEIKSMLQNGSERKDIVRSITSHYKKQYLAAKESGKYADLKNLLIASYMMAGLTHGEAMEKIDGWKEVKKD